MSSRARGGPVVKIQWRNVAVFAVAFACAGGLTVWQDIPLWVAIQLVALGVAPCAVIVRLGWLGAHRRRP